MGRAAVRKRDVAIRRHDLERLQRELKKYEVEAVEKLVELMRTSEDSKIVRAAATSLIGYSESVAKTIDQSELSRLIVSMKTTQYITAVPEENKPAINFTDIHPDFADQQDEDEITVIDMTDIKSLG